MKREAFDEVARTADLFLNISGACMPPEHLSAQCIKVFLDTDPGYNQIMLHERFKWSENVDRWYASILDHNQFFTYAENIHNSGCLVPKMGLKWKTTRMPVVMDLWNPIARILPSDVAPWTTIMTWKAFKGKLMYQGVEYKSKGSEFERFVVLPKRTTLPLKVALGGENAPFEKLANHGWEVVDGPSTSRTPNQYQEFISNSRGEISPAKHVYVAMRTGWFSCRSACYLAGGRPVVLQDTGFTKALPVGEGILSFTTLEEAVAAMHDVEANYAYHAKAAYGIAEEYFDSAKVLTKLIKEAMDIYD
jgi:hypothetical protein